MISDEGYFFACPVPCPVPCAVSRVRSRVPSRLPSRVPSNKKAGYPIGEAVPSLRLRPRNSGYIEIYLYLGIHIDIQNIYIHLDTSTLEVFNGTHGLSALSPNPPGTSRPSGLPIAWAFVPWGRYTNLYKCWHFFSNPNQFVQRFSIELIRRIHFQDTFSELFAGYQQVV